PAHLDHGSLQLPLHVLHAGGGDAMAAPLGRDAVRGDRPPRADLRRALRGRRDPTDRWRADSARPRARPGVTDRPAASADQSHACPHADCNVPVGVSPTQTNPFCGDCYRVRLTADVRFRTCLFATDDHDLLSLMRAAADDDRVAEAIERAVGTKWAGHRINTV